MSMPGSLLGGGACLCWRRCLPLLVNSSKRGYPAFIDEMEHFEAKMTLDECQQMIATFECQEDLSKHSAPVAAFFANQVPVNRPVEDRWHATRSPFDPGLVFGVFDGHAGPACAHAISHTISDYIFASVMSGRDLELAYHYLVRDNICEQLADAIRQHQIGPLPPEVHKVHNANLRRFLIEQTSTGDGDDTVHYQSALSLGFSRLDNDLHSSAKTSSAESLNLPLIRAVSSGCVACVAFVRDRDLVVAQVGDSGAVLGQLNDQGELVAKKMTEEHNASNVSEVTRLLRAHPVSESGSLLRSDRLFGELVPLRTFGNIRFKWSASELRETAVLLGVPPTYSVHPRHYLTPPYLSSMPDVLHHRLTARDRFLILASDGLWDVLSAGEAAQVVEEALADPACPNPATQLILTALGGSAQGIDFNRVSVMLSIPGTVARNYRDDITAVVVKFDAP